MAAFVACGLSVFMVALPVRASPWEQTTVTGARLRIVADEVAGGMRLQIENRRANGKLDPSFGRGGRTPVALGPDNELPTSLKLDGEGRLLLMGAARASNGETQAVVLRLLPNGAPDPAWGTQGRSSASPVAGDARALDAQALPDGRVLVVGSAEVSGLERAVAWHLNADGSLETGASPSGRFMLARTEASRITALTPLNNNQVMMAVRIVTDSVTLLEGHLYDVKDVDAAPKLLTRQAWPPAWSDAPQWVGPVSAGRWTDSERTEQVIDAVPLATGDPAVAWTSLRASLAGTAAGAAPKIDDASAGGAAFSPFAAGRITMGPDKAAESIYYWFGGLFVGAVLLAALMVCVMRRVSNGASKFPDEG